MDLSVNSTLNKLILLLVFDKMDFPVMGENIETIASNANNWIPWMECRETIGHLLETGFIYQTLHENKFYYAITPDGRTCLSLYYTRVPATLRAEIAQYIRDNRMSFRRKQEYFATYGRNPDGTHWVSLRIVNLEQIVFDLKLNVATRHAAKVACTKWEEKAPQVYQVLHENLID